MTRKEILDQISNTLGGVPGWLERLKDEQQLTSVWGSLLWFMSDSKLAARDKALIGFGVAAATHCPY
jgi:hypothetical protein